MTQSLIPQLSWEHTSYWCLFSLSFFRYKFSKPVLRVQGFRSKQDNASKTLDWYDKTAIDYDAVSS